MRDFRQAFRMMREVYKVANILVCDDDKDIVEAISIYLEQEGYVVFKAYDGLEAIEILKKEDIQLLLIDVMMPRLDGLRATLKIREKSGIPIIILSAKSEDSDKVIGLDVGADDYITKPFDMEEVLARIESNLRRVQFQNSQTECLQHNNLTLDLEKNTAFLNGIELSLTAKEFGILELLMKYPDKVFSKSNLFQSVWDTEYIAEDNTLNVHISNLRNKLKAICSDTEFIDTVWGIGYRLHKAKD